MLRILLTLWLLQPAPAEPAASAAPAWREKAIEWMVAQRMAFDHLTAEQGQEMSGRMEKLPDAALRVMVQVYEREYGARAPLGDDELRPADPSEAMREWIVAYRIVYDNLKGEEAKAYFQSLEKLSEGQLRALGRAYQQKLRQQRDREKLAGNSPTPTPQPNANPGGSDSLEPPPTPTPTPDERTAAQERLREAEATMAFEQERRQIALGRAGQQRNLTNRAQQLANTGAAATAAASNAILSEQRSFARANYMQGQSFNNAMYARGSYPLGRSYWMW